MLRLGISDGFTYAWSASAPFGSKVDPASIKLNGVTLDPTATYRVAANNFIADGGDSFTAFVNGAPRTGGKVDLDALIDYFDGTPGRRPGARDAEHPAPVAVARRPDTDARRGRPARGRRLSALLVRRVRQPTGAGRPGPGRSDGASLGSFGSTNR